MFTTNETIKGVHGIPQNQIDLLRAYLQGAVYCWCNSAQKYDVFYARDFLGGENFFWEDTPAEALYRYNMERSDEEHDIPIMTVLFYNYLARVFSNRNGFGIIVIA